MTQEKFSRDQSQMPLEPVTCLDWQGYTLVPAYDGRDHFMLPGHHRRVSGAVLRNNGARPVVKILWPRGKQS